MYIGQSVLATLKTVCQLLVIKAQQVHDRGLQVMDVDFIFSDLKAEFIRLAVVEAALHAATRHPHCEAIRIVIAAQYFAGGRATFAKRRATKFAAADNQSVFQKSSLL